MSFFKRSNKNKSASAASSPAQTPRASMQSSRSSDVKLTHEQAIYKITHNKLTFAAAGMCVQGSLTMTMCADPIHMDDGMDKSFSGHDVKVEPRGIFDFY
ncbi:hypothetical protein EC957_006426 [Mortierella hygrophila]|uniref:Uncharacterized protein n=1 Tax=Mortierella hygrophila TaxID=979708 RepID=A0A9P6EZQ0_9FUNG|nr:hypothetical protein EC957_006426 [Mortierella hygrophila]